ncbi:MAG: hypothetical protein ACQKBY_05200 [Verrucomicrobiales bacterium]
MKQLHFLIFGLLALLLVSCDDDQEEQSEQGPENQIQGESVEERRVTFIGTETATSTENYQGSVLTARRVADTDLVLSFLSDGILQTKGTKTVVSEDSTIREIPESVGRVITIDEIGTYTFSFDDDSRQTATLLTYDDENNESIIHLIFSSETGGTYTRFSDQTKDGVRRVVDADGNFEIQP